MRIALDAMGGDNAPRETVRGALAAADQLPDAQIVLIGDRAVIRAELESNGAAADRFEIAHADQVVEMHESPIAALRTKPNSSIMVMAHLAAERNVDAVVSAGNTGASVAAMHKIVRRLDGVIRSGISVSIPTVRGQVIVCDMGANTSARPEHLYQYAVMASLYAEHVSGIENPSVALLSVGHERNKGNALVKDAYKLLEADPKLNFTGNVEGHDLYLGTADVVICDGFVGNIVLKLIEAMGTGIVKMMDQHLHQAGEAAFKRIEPHLKQVFDKYDCGAYGGAPLLGINGVFIKCHGASGSLSITNGIIKADLFARNHVNELITERLGGGNACSVDKTVESQHE